MRMPLIVAHRGASSECPENTLIAFRRALEQNADAIEADCWLTADGHVIVSHDGNTKRTCGEPGVEIARTNFADLRGFDAGRWKGDQFVGERLPALSELLDLRPPSKRAFLEIKCGPEIVPAFVRDLRASKLRPEQLVMITFNEPVIPAFKAAMPEVRSLLLYEFKKGAEGRYTETADGLIARAKSLGADGLDVSMSPTSIGAVTPELIAKAAAAGLSVHAWTIDDPSVARRAIELGIASITTNRPGALRAEIEAMDIPLAR